MLIVVRIRVMVLKVLSSVVVVCWLLSELLMVVFRVCVWIMRFGFSVWSFFLVMSSVVVGLFLMCVIMLVVVE